MSGMKKLAAAVATDPSFAKQTDGMMSVADAKQYVDASIKSDAPKGTKQPQKGR